MERFAGSGWNRSSLQLREHAFLHALDLRPAFESDIPRNFGNGDAGTALYPE
jgi:hypothetical protein